LFTVRETTWLKPQCKNFSSSVFVSCTVYRFFLNSSEWRRRHFQEINKNSITCVETAKSHNKDYFKSGIKTYISLLSILWQTRSGQNIRTSYNITDNFFVIIICLLNFDTVLIVNQLWRPSNSIGLLQVLDTAVN